MEKVILETIQRGVHSYHKIESFPVTMGRAFDNDIILQDVTISPHHLIIDKEDGNYLIKNLSTENGTTLEGKKLGSEPAMLDIPAHFKLNNLKARLLSTDMPVEDTYVQNCSGLFCFFSSPIWAALLFLATVAIFFIERFLDTPVAKEPLFYISNVLPSVWTLLGITVVISGITRISTHRWEIIPAISIASMVFLVPQLFEYLGHFASYLFTADSFGSWLQNIASFMIIPLLLALFIVKTIHTKWLPALGVAALVYSPFLAYQVINLVDDLNLKSGFSEIPGYSQTLLPSDIRLNTTISLDDYIKDADKETSSIIEDMLIEAKKKEAKS